MTTLPMFAPLLWTVSDLTRYLRDLIESDAILRDVWIQGEVSNLSRPASGHMYFTLKDRSSSLKCVMWRNTVLRQAIIPRDGQAIEVHGSLGVYEVSGQYQLYADLLRPAGEDILYQNFLRLKARLEAEGLFEAERKRPIPHWPERIGIVTSPTGAAWRDILHTLRRRFPSVHIVLAPSQVQGEEAPGQIINALQSLNRIAKPDVIIIARGGGSIEDLWAFNDEGVARALADSPSPVISGIGHETDFTIADFVSDLRAPTPTAAAELATPNRIDLLNELYNETQRLGRAMNSIHSTVENRLDRLSHRLILYSPYARLRSYRQRLDDLLHRVIKALDNYLALEQSRLSGEEKHLDSLNPFSILKRGYAIVSKQDGEIIHSTQQVESGDAILIQVSDGSFSAQVQGNP